jgi:hypothetical protein
MGFVRPSIQTSIAAQWASRTKKPPLNWVSRPGYSEPGGQALNRTDEVPSESRKSRRGPGPVP